MVQCFACFGPSKKQRREEERVASEAACRKAAEAAERRQKDFEKSAAGRAAKAQIAAMSKNSGSTNKGEPVLRWQVG